ncbi:hypothetical protein ACIQV3_32665 [Streptomyces sp. NPDC099050]
MTAAGRSHGLMCRKITEVLGKSSGASALPVRGSACRRVQEPPAC